MSARTYKDVRIDHALKEYSEEKGYTHAAHAAMYAATDKVLVGKYPFRYYVSVGCSMLAMWFGLNILCLFVCCCCCCVKMQMRFDGTLGFAGGIVDAGETPEEAVNRELSEEFGRSGFCQIF